MDLDLGGSRYHSPALTSTPTQQVHAYEWRRRLVRWPIVTGSMTVQLFGEGAAVDGLDLVLVLYDVTHAVEACRSATITGAGADIDQDDLAAITAVTIPRPDVSENTLYDLYGEVTSGDETKTVLFLGGIRIL